METTIEIAKCTLAEFFDFDVKEFDRKKTRRRNVVEARRYLVYFLIDELNIKFSDVSQYMKSITHHASAMFHFYKMIDFCDESGLGYEKKTHLNYLKFKEKMVERGLQSLEEELNKQIEIRNVANSNIDKLKKMLDEA